MNLYDDRPKGIDLHCCDFRELPIPDNAVSLIVADPVWSELQQFEDLAPWAKRVLKPGGRLLLFSGNYDLPDKVAAIAQHLTFVLPLGIVSTYPRARLVERLQSGLPLYQAMPKPIKRYTGIARLQWLEALQPLTLWANGPWNVTQILTPFYNVFLDEGFTKEFHEYQQSLAAIRYYVDLLTDPGDLVVEPFGGGFTGAQAVRLLNKDDPGRNLRCIACDIKPGCVETGWKRLMETDR